MEKEKEDNRFTYSSDLGLELVKEEKKGTKKEEKKIKKSYTDYL